MPYSNREYRLAYNRVRGRMWYAANKTYRQKYRKKTAKRRKQIHMAWYALNHENILQRARKKYAQNREKALKAVMDVHGVQGCHVMIHPHMPMELKEHKCWGKLTFEHPNGGGRKSRTLKTGTVSNSLVRRLINNSEKPKDYMVLCQLHQIWNSAFK